MKILLAIDESAHSSAAVHAVGVRPWPPGTIVRVLSAVQYLPPPAAELWYDAGGSLELAQQDLRERAEQLTVGAAEALRARGLSAEPVVRTGDPRAVIVDEAHDWDADLIVVGSHGYSGLKRFLIGSIALSVVNHAPCSVEVIRTKPAATENSEVNAKE